MEDNLIDRTIKRIEVKNLFGYYNYRIDNSTNDFDKNHLLIIYGDNGSGKTTLLKMIFYLLSPMTNSGHKTSLCRIKFSKFSITLNDNTTISAERPDNLTYGSYNLYIRNNKKKIADVFLEADAEGTIRLSETPSEETKYLRFLDIIKDLKVSINFLSDERKLLSFSEKLISQKLRRNKNIIHNIRGAFEISSSEDEEEDIESGVNFSVKKLENWLKSNVLKGAKAGEENANTIYTSLIKRVSSPKVKQVDGAQVAALLSKIKNIAVESKKYHETGLVSEVEVVSFENALVSAKDSNRILIFNVIEPYIEGLQGRLNSLRSVQNILSLFLNSINDYFYNKSITYNIDSGFKLKNLYNEQPIEFQTLSSGEKQLLNLFCNVITSSSNSTVFIIDEPEISLNIKWQRKLINTLLSLAINKKIQFIFASHSIELLSGHRNSVFKLSNLES